MSKKNLFALAGSLLILGMNLVFAQAETKATARNEVRNEVQKRTESRAQAQKMFVDENGDGINDLYRDHDNDGLPNCQDPDWKRPENGTGYKSRNGNQSGQNWNRNSFGKNRGSFGNGICDGTGPKGKSSRKGRG